VARFAACVPGSVSLSELESNPAKDKETRFMPDPTDVPELVEALTQFARDHEGFVAGPEGKRTLSALKRFNRDMRATGPETVLGKHALPDAEITMAWLSRMPRVFLGHAKAPLISLERMEPKAQSLAVAAALQVLAAGSKALLLGGAVKDGDNERLPLAILQVAFGADSASSTLRKALVDPRWPLPPGWKVPDQSRLAELVVAGTLREMLQTFARCGMAARNDRRQTQLLRTYGRVDSLTPPRACAGHSIDVGYSLFGNAPAAGSDVLVSVPTHSGCVHFAFSRIAPRLLSPGGWQPSGVVRVTLPDTVSTGAVGFFLMPPAPASTGGCETGSLAGAAGMLQSVLGEVLGAAGVLTGQVVLNVANHVEAARFGALPCASRQTDGRNWLLAGAPLIDRFALVNEGPVHPRGTVTLEWVVNNADRVTIVPRALAHSAQHQLPPVPLPLPTSGRITLPVTCTERWEAEYVLEATNGNGCPGTPAERAVLVRSGFSHWLLGVGTADITDRRPGLPMAGFAYKQQTSSGEVQRNLANNEMPLLARAFYIGENRPPTDRQELVIVVADIWTCTIAVKDAVVKALNMRFAPRDGEVRFDHANVMIAGTHTHAGPGGYSHYPLYNLTIDGFDDTVFGTIVHGIASAAGQAVDASQAGRLFVNAGEVADCGVNRSMPAFERNPEAAAGEEPTDRSMLLLKLVVDDVNSPGGSKEIGAVNWYAMHPTSLGMYNRVVSGDNKGWAEMLFESEMASRGKRVVAAFGNANAGDVSGNYVRNASGDPEFRRPLGGEMPEGMAIPPRIADPNDTATDIANMRAIGLKQYLRALALFDDQAATEVTGRLHMKHAFVDMSNVPIAGVPNACTWPAALGVSFGAGSSEDSIAYATMGDVDIDAGIPEGVTLAVNVLGGVTAVVAIIGMVGLAPAAVTQLPGVLATVLTGAPLPAGVVRLLLPLLGVVLFPPTRAFIAARLAAGSLAGQIPLPHPDEGTGRWFLPDVFGYDPGYETGHGEKPIMFPVGLAKVTFTPAAGSTLPTLDDAACPLVPHVVPMHLVRIGGVVLAGVPAEFTATAGRRLKQTLATAFGADMSHAAIVGYCNGYSGYVTTREEYGAQQYEGASTLYGEFTLMAYQQTFSALAGALSGGPEVASEETSFRVPLVVRTRGPRP
jgi:hypothetical protein